MDPDIGPGRKLEYYASLASNLDCKAAGGMECAARKIAVALTAGFVAVVNDQDGTEANVYLNVTEVEIGQFREIALGNKAVRTSSAGSYPASSLGGKTMVLRLDENTIKDTGANITVTFDDTDTTQALILARINAALSAAMEETVALAADAGSDVSTITSRARGTAAAVEIVSIHADVATATGFSAGTSNGDATGAAGGIRVTW